MNIIKAMQDPNLFGQHFQPLESWSTWIVVLSAIFGLPLTRQQRRLFHKLTGRKYDKKLTPQEIWLVIGRRGGKSKIVALIATYLACFYDYESYLSHGEIGHVMVIATDRKQAKIILRYIEAYIEGSPYLNKMVLRTTAESIELNNNIHITVSSCSLRSVRGYTVVAAIADEIAFWRSDESANPDTEVLNAIRPAMSTIPTALLICLSSPYARRGAMWDAFKNYYGNEDNSILVCQASTETMNPTIPLDFLQREEARDPLAYASEYLANFRTGITAALAQEWIDAACISPNLDVPRSVHSRPYRAFVDISGGRSDSAALAIAHMEPDDEIVYVDLVRRYQPPFSPENIAQQMADEMANYGLYTVTGDNYAADLTVELFNKAGVGYERSKDSASDLYLQSIPLFSTGKLQAPDHPILRRELSGLERRVRVGGKDVVTHPPGGHDDLANAMCGAMVQAWRARQGITSEIFVVPGMAHDGALVTEHEGSAPWRFL